MTPLGRIVRELIAAEGPMTVERYMALALGHPAHGYYATRDPLGRAGDFVTAPEISQMFGELLGLWAASIWTAMGSPSPIRLVELGPGRGTLMADALRAARLAPGFLAAIRLHLVETSPVLRARQEATLAGLPGSPAWHAAFDDVPEGPAIVIANEFFDAIPIRQFVGHAGGWRERMVGLGPDGSLAFGLAPGPETRLRAGGRDGDVIEIAAVGERIAGAIAARLADEGGAALIVDYGHVRPGRGDTLQAVRGHAYADPLAAPGEQDLTAHVDFAALAGAAARAGARLHGPASQGAFLRALGIEARAARLDDAAGARRLAGDGPGEMGALFKVMALSHPVLADIPGLPARAKATTDLEPAC